LVTDTKTGFDAALYKRISAPLYVLAFRGTESPTTIDGVVDWAQNFHQGHGGLADQYRRAAEMAKVVSQNVAELKNGSVLAITGHSLGGGLAATGGISSGRVSTTFNAAGVHQNTILTYAAVPRNKFSNLVRGYHLNGEILTTLQQGDWSALGLLMPNALGQQITVPSFDERGVILPIQSVLEAGDLHRMPSVLQRSFPYWKNGSRYINIGGGISLDPTYVPK
jgi:hypothetical protein